MEHHWQEDVRQIAHGIRKRSLEVTLQKNGCYLSQALSSAEILATLYGKVMKLGPSMGEMVPPHLSGEQESRPIPPPNGGRYHGEKAAGTDRFVISPAHYAIAVYAALVEVGRLSPEGLMQFNTDGSTVEMIGAEHSPGFELTTGSFGQCISQAGGIAHVRKRNGDTGRVFIFLSDGELQEGQTWEGIQAMAFYKLDNAVILVDVNGQQVDGYTKDVMNIEPLDRRFEAFGARVVTVDGHDVEAIGAATHMGAEGKPLVILCYTDTCRGLPLLEKRKPKLHYVRFAPEEKMEFERFYQTM